MLITWKVIYKTKMIPSHEVDLFSGKREIDEDEAEFIEEAGKKKLTWYQKAWEGA